ncbi:TonB-dependent receptor [Thalassotalea sp. LPB0316]|uniref:TonB-dependent receptor plug domain-containing protein n=1 Tax=Thalassotalea sp. LPB0316 TaxID=2769490 RepID=UPI001865AEA0|nr:TonB-dependent receptor [Thalassotalea sp. LPB0316]QOL25730.1 TonB-dependent receptor [Thalassotalea sp. LPB0316]
MKKFTLSAVALSVLAIFNANAQEGSNQSNETAAIEKITVTGSQIKGVDLEGTQPLVVIDAQAIRSSGASSISELMAQISQTRGGVGSFNTSESGATSTSTPAGQAAASLRGLGPSSTLTLINGRRVAASSFAAGTQNFVDINSIPLSAIERVEVLATGASAIYGADAVAGVINYILKTDYQGAEINGSYGNSFASSDEGRYNLNFIWGGEVAGGNLTVFADHFDRNAFHAQDRSYTRDPVLVSNYSYLPKHTPNIYYYSAYDGNEIGNPDCKTDFVTTEYGEEICAYYSNEDDQLRSALETSSAGFIYSYDFNDVTWNTDFFISNTKSRAVSSPAPIDQVDDTEGPWVGEEAIYGAFSPEVADALIYDMWIDPFDTQAGQQLWGFRYDARFASPRTVDIETDAMRLVSSLSGEWGEWFWETGITLSKSESEQVASAGIYNRYKYHAVSTGELCSNGSIADYDYDSDTLSCGAGELLGTYNPFLSGDATNDALLAMAQEMPTRDGESTVYGIDAKISGDIAEVNDHMISAAFGVEFRREEINDIPSMNARARFENDYLVDVFGFGSSLSQADRNQWGAFAEFYWPITDQIELQLAGRYDDYNDFGDTFNPKVGVTYRPHESVILRAAWSTSFRAPSLTQAGVKLRTTTATYDCSANQAVADLYCEGDGFTSSPNVLELGNANLKPEESESVSLGFAWSPSSDTHLSLDYWSFKHEQLIDTDMTAVLNDAINDASLRHCGLVPEGSMGISYEEVLCSGIVDDGVLYEFLDSNGLNIEQDGANLTQILDQWVAAGFGREDALPLYRDHVIQLDNTGTQEVSGFDLAFDHSVNFAEGRLTFSIDGTHYASFERNLAGSSDVEELIGTWRYPENIASFRLGWVGEQFYTSITADYTSSYQDDIKRLRGRNIDELEALGELDANGERDVDSWTTVRFNMGYDFDNMNLNFTVHNLFDEEPPVAYGSRRGFDSINHNALGVNYQLSFSYFFK